MKHHAPSAGKPDPGKEELYCLATLALCGDISDAETRRLECLIMDNPEVRRLYVEFICDASNIRLLMGRSRSETPGPKLPAHNPSPLIPPIVAGLSSPTHPPLLGLYSPVGGLLFSYTASALILGLALLIGWTWRPSCACDQRVGRITGLVDCRWADPADATWAYVSLGRKYAVASGFLEITYDTGTRVILEGPATYEIESASGGFLSLGKLTARVEKKDSGFGVQGSEVWGERTANLPSSFVREREPTTSLAPRLSSSESEISNPQSLTPNSALFSVRTSTAIVADLGTEFGVEVDRSGRSETHVFRGKVELRPTGGGENRFSSADGWGGGSGSAIQLEANEFATVEPGQGQIAKVVRNADQAIAPAFARQMPKRIPLQLFSTGVGLRAGAEDPHWLLTARSDVPNFKPRPAVVTTACRDWLLDHPKWSQWLSTADGPPSLPKGTFTFRTTFSLADASPIQTFLRGRFLVGDIVGAIRLNGRNLEVPKPGLDEPFQPMHELATFVATDGFVQGTNVLEIDVVNTNDRTPLGLRVELEGYSYSSSVSPLPTHKTPAHEHGRGDGSTARPANLCAAVILDFVSFIS